MAEIYISEFSSLNFRHDWAYGFQMPACYLQQFLPSDIIRVQAAVPLAGTFRPTFRIVDLADGTSFAPQIGQYSSDTYLICDITPGMVLEAGSYRFEISDGNQVIHYSEFGVCDSLPGTVLLTAAHYRNEFDAIFQDGQVFGLRMAAFFPQSRAQIPFFSILWPIPCRERYCSHREEGLPDARLQGDDRGVPAHPRLLETDFRQKLTGRNKEKRLTFSITA